MSNPHTKNGYTKLANELLEALAQVHMTNYERRVLDVVVRMTYGWGRKMVDMDECQLARRTGLQRQNTYRALKALIDRNIIIRKRNKVGLQKKYVDWLDHERNQMRLQLNFDMEDPSSPAITPRSRGRLQGEPPAITPRSRGRLQTPSKNSNAKPKTNTLKKERKSKERKKESVAQSPPDKRKKEIDIIINALQNVMDIPALDGTMKDNRQAAWNLMRKYTKIARENGNRNPEGMALQLIIGCIEAAKADDFWRGNITSVVKLHRNFLSIIKKNQKSLSHSPIADV